MASLMKCCLSLLLGMTAIIQLYGQEAGFVSIDCGYSGSLYKDSKTTLHFISDDAYVDTGIKKEIATRYQSPSLSKQSLTLRSFPSSTKRNCYTLPANQNERYLLRAIFMYGDYDDGLTMSMNKNSFIFGLHIGIDSWANVSIDDSSIDYMFEAITVSPADFISVCLVNMNQGTPFISSLEMRPLGSSLYPAASLDQTYALSFRYNMGPKDDNIIRYPIDPYDRIWRSYNNYSSTKWSERTNSGTVKYLSGDPFQVPSDVLLTAVEPTGLEKSWSISFSWYPDKFVNDPNYYLILHFCELWYNSSAIRKIDIYLNGGQVYMSSKTTVANYLVAGSVYSILPISGRSSYYFDLYGSSDSSFVPLLNAMEVYYTVTMSKAVTLPSDVRAMNGIKKAYNINIASWQGDPCSPIGYTWDHVGCTSVNNTLRITSIDLSSRKLADTISNNISILIELVFLDLSNNELSGQIPDFLGSLASLKVLNLSGNCFSGPIPNNILNKTGLTLRYEGYNTACKKGSFNHTLIIIIPCVAVVALLVAVLVFFICRKIRKSRDAAIRNETTPPVQAVPMGPLIQESPAKVVKYKNEPQISQIPEIRKFSYSELQKITNNFVRCIGEGGFGPVYHGYLHDKKEVAVKMHAESSNHGINEFLSEVGFLAKVHHRNLVRLVGYCMEETHLGLVCEFMSQGSLADHLRGNAGRNAGTKVLNWRERLQIALDAAQGLDYLHTGCDAPIIHRDVKSSNILLDQDLHAKIADFGISRAFEDYQQTHMSINPAGTQGYIDIEYQLTGRLTQKSDVYSFGVVLLELITGEPPIVPGKPHLTRWVNEMLQQGNIDDITYKMLGGNYDINSVWKIVDLAIECTKDSSRQRPTMNRAVTQLKEILALEITRDDRSGTGTATSTDSYWNKAAGSMSDTFGPMPR